MKYPHQGHRQRMYARMAQEELLPDHELLEVMLYGSIPRRNTSDLAHRLLAKFGTLLGVYSAPIEALMEVEGIGDAVARHIYVTGLVYRRHFAQRQTLFFGEFDPERFFPYVKTMYDHEPCEVLDVYILDEKSGIMGVRRFTDADVHSVGLDPAKISRFLMESMPAGVLLVHNHPQGNGNPSPADDETTKCCQILCNMYGCLLCDHIIYAPEGLFSYYMSGRMSEISKGYNVNLLTKNKGGR